MQRVYSYNAGAHTGHILRGIFLANHLASTDNLNTNATNAT